MSRMSGLLASIGNAAERLGTNIQASSNRRIAHRAFDSWSRGQGSLFDLMDDDATIVIPGTSKHCRTLRKAAFIREVAGPFMARFSEPPRPTPIRLWAEGATVVVMAEAKATRHDGKPYRNDYVFVLEFRRSRVVRAIEFLDMAAFNDVWDCVEPAPAVEPRG